MYVCSATDWPVAPPRLLEPALPPPPHAARIAAAQAIWNASRRVRGRRELVVWCMGAPEVRGSRRSIAAGHCRKGGAPPSTRPAATRAGCDIVGAARAAARRPVDERRLAVRGPRDARSMRVDRW